MYTTFIQVNFVVGFFIYQKENEASFKEWEHKLK